MKYIILLIIILVIMFFLLFGFGINLPKEYEYNENEIFKANAEDIFTIITDYKNLSKINPDIIKTKKLTDKIPTWRIFYKNGAWADIRIILFETPTKHITRIINYSGHIVYNWNIEINQQIGKSILLITEIRKISNPIWRAIYYFNNPRNGKIKEIMLNINKILNETKISKEQK